jgi:hypothetical protein
MIGRACVAVLALVSCGAAAQASDAWDLQTNNDNLRTTTRNGLIHGSEQWHDLAAVGGVGDEDWYPISPTPYSSYEVVLDALSGDVAFSSTLLVRTSEEGSALDSAATLGVGALAVRFENATSDWLNQYIRVLPSTECTACTSEDTYRIRYFETTCSIPRFNNAGTQTTVLILQNADSHHANGHVYFWSPSAVLLATHAFALEARATLVLNTSTISGVAGQSGSITISYRGGYGSLSGKAVALEPATGFSFDSPMLVRPH